MRRPGKAGSTAMLPFACANWSERLQLIRRLFEEFLQKAKISDEQSTLQARDARVVRPAQPGGQSFPDRQRVFMTALLLGFGLGVGGAILIEMLKHGFTTPQQVEKSLGVPVLASVQRMEAGKLKKNGTIPPVALYQ